MTPDIDPVCGMKFAGDKLRSRFIAVRSIQRPI